ncbi:MAG: serine--tRNA ligase [Chitinivibrionales bacterium]|nr:serine--tRNA ligase [Chitinivibrionales bacterium]
MLDLKRIRENPDEVKKAVTNKNDHADIDKIVRLDDERRRLTHEAEKMKHIRNEASQKIAALKKQKKEATDQIKEMKEVSARIKDMDERLRVIESECSHELIRVPNIPHSSVPHGTSEADNPEVAAWGEIRQADFELKDHLELGESLDIIDFTRGAKISGAGFPVLKGHGALLERALINCFLDTHTIHNGYREVFPPFLANADSHFGTGQLPKSQEQMYYIGEDELYCIPTAEVPVTNLHRGELLDADQLPLNYCAYSACFRREAGSYGKDTKGYLRVHQFNKVELVKFVKPETSYDELEVLRGNAEHILQSLELPYRVVELCDADLSFAAAKCYDLEVWAPGEGKYLEVSSCSNFEDFQARRLNIRYRPEPGAKPEYIHTLNGSGVATARILVALLETYQTPGGTITIPGVLRPYMRGMTEITAT